MTPAGGIERVIATLANKFSKSYKVTILVKDKAYSHYKLNEDIKLISLNNKLSFDMNNKLSRIFTAAENFVSSSKKLKEFLKLNEFDFIYIAHPLNALEMFFARGIDDKVIFTEHGGIDAYNIFYKKIKHWLYKKGRCYVVPTTTDTKLYLNQNLPAICIPHLKSDLNYIKSLLKNKIALSIGRMTEAKRQWILIDLWEKIVKKHNITDWELHIVGNGNLKETYLESIRSKGLEDYVKIIEPQKNVEKFYENASVFLLTSESEGFGMVLLEAISFGLPCVSYDSPSGPRDIIEHKKNGFLVPYNNEEELEKYTLMILQDEKLLNTLGNQAFIDSQKWNDEIILEKWKKILN